VVALQMTEHTVNDFIMSEAVQADQNGLLKQDWMKMISDVVRENQRQLFSLATAGVAIASKQFSELVEFTDEERKEAWATFFLMDHLRTSHMPSSYKSKSTRSMTLLCQKLYRILRMSCSSKTG